jgi:catechol 2,3-dioxygenase-like lactoylglutathione lyase family enzyme
MKSFIYHFQVNVSNKEKSLPFWKDMLSYLDYKVVDEGGWGIGMGDNLTDIWIMPTEEKYKMNKYHRKGTGLNHIAFGVSTHEDVDKFIEEFLKPKNINFLYDSPREYPEYEKGYYAVFFEDPDRIKLEVVYKPGFDERRIK